MSSTALLIMALLTIARLTMVLLSTRRCTYEGAIRTRVRRTAAHGRLGVRARPDLVRHEDEGRVPPGIGAPDLWHVI